VTGISQLLLPDQAAGSLIERDGKLIGSRLIGQNFTDPKYFWGRPAATGPYRYHANTQPVPVDLVTASGSGLDPHISPAAAEYQVARIARIRGVSPTVVRDAVAQQTQGRQWGILGEARVNVLELNLALDHLPLTKNP
jgi:K+-transporting ATPase ATPase C chain